MVAKKRCKKGYRKSKTGNSCVKKQGAQIKMKNGECKRTKTGRKYCKRGGKVKFVKG